MKITLGFASLFIIFSAAYGQQPGELGELSNGLMYSETTMDNLKHITDSINLEFEHCPLPKTYYSISQTKGHYFCLKGRNIKQAKADVENHLPFDEFLKKYPEVEVDSNQLIVRRKKNAGEYPKIYFNSIDVNGSGGGQVVFYNDIDKHEQESECVVTWGSSYSETGKMDTIIKGIYFLEGFSQKAIPKKYARMIYYADCMIDTNTLVIHESAKGGYPIPMPENLSDLSQMEKKMLLEQMRHIKIRIGLLGDLAKAFVHTNNIAVLSAETANWETFLRAHLDIILNDRFGRVGDFGYAWEQRQTYIKELEELDINVPDLMFGITFRMKNPSQNHYDGTTAQLERVLSATKDRESIEDRILSMIADSQLDDYNRVLLYLLFLDYSQYIEDEKDRKGNIEKLKAATDKMPDYIKNKLVWDEK